MHRRVHHIIVGSVWSLGSFVVWFTVCSGIDHFLAYLINERRVKFPTQIAHAFYWMSTAGFVLIPATVAVLAMRACLPGTGTRPSRVRGFPIDEPPPAGPS